MILEKLTLAAAALERWAYFKHHTGLEHWAHAQRERYRAAVDRRLMAPPKAGERVIFCQHVDAGPRHVHLNASPERPFHWYRLGGPTTRSDGRELNARWLGLCDWCSKQATEETAVLFARFDARWVGPPPRIKPV